MSRYHPYGNRHRDGAGDHAPHINLTYVDGDVHVELRKHIQSGAQRTLILKVEQFFDISFKSDILKYTRIPCQDDKNKSRLASSLITV